MLAQAQGCCLTLGDLIEQARKRGTDDDFRRWVQRQPSCISGRFSEYVDGEGRCIAAHVRRAADSGTGYKAEFACVPLTNDEHQLQHQRGESALASKAFFDEQRVRYLKKWIASGISKGTG